MQCFITSLQSHIYLLTYLKRVLLPLPEKNVDKKKCKQTQQEATVKR